MAIAFVIFLVILFYWIFMVVKKRNLPPGPWGLPLLGYLPFLHPKYAHKTLSDLADKYGPVYGLNLGGTYVVVLSDAQLIKKIFVQDAYNHRASLYLIDELFNGKGELWRCQRKMAVGFLGQYTKKKGCLSAELNTVLKEEAEYFLEEIAKMLNVPLDLSNELNVPITNIICRLVFGRRYSKDDPWNKRQLHLSEEGAKQADVAGAVNFFPVLRFLPHFQKICKFLKDGLIETHQGYIQIIDEHKDEKCNDFIDFYLSKMDEANVYNKYESGLMSMKHLCFVLGDFYGAATDTTKATILWLFLYTAMYPDVQFLVHEEIDQNIPMDRLPDVLDMKYLPYVQATFMEAQRLGNISPMGVPHGTATETTLNGYNIPSKSMIIPLLFKMNINSDVWDCSWTFDPCRFLDENKSVRQPDFFLPFLTGKRRCPGEDLAKQSIFVLYTSFMQKYDIRLAEENVDYVPACSLIMGPKEYKVIVTSRSQKCSSM